MMKILFACAFLCCIQLHAQMKLTKEDVLELKNRLEGNFDNQEQAQKDKSYSNISLHLKEVMFNAKAKPSLKTKTKKPIKQVEGYYLYVEQSMMSAPEKPTYQQIYFLSHSGDSVLVCQVYDMKAPFRFVGAWNDVASLKALSLDSLTEKPGCTMYFYKNNDGNYYGGTRGGGCENYTNGSTYNTIETTIYSGMIVGWFKGWNNLGKQVWGTEKAAYRFRKFIPLHRKD
jgi:hypothetical protein